MKVSSDIRLAAANICGLSYVAICILESQEIQAKLFLIRIFLERK